MSPTPDTYPHTHTTVAQPPQTLPMLLHTTVPPNTQHCITATPTCIQLSFWPKGAAQGGCPILKRPCACVCFGVCIFPQTPPLRFLTTRELQARQGRKKKPQKRDRGGDIDLLYVSLVSAFLLSSLQCGQALPVSVHFCLSLTFE